MKKIMTLLLCIVLTASGCSSDVDSAKNEGASDASRSSQETIEQESSGEGESQENKENTENADSDQATADIHNKSQVMEAFYTFYLEDVEDDNIQDRDFIESNLSFAYDDYNNDGQQDVLCYSESPKSTFLFMAILTPDGKDFKRVEGELASICSYEQAVEKEGDFIIQTYRGGGSGVQVTSRHLYYVDKGKIVDTGVNLDTEGTLSIPPMGNDQKGVSQSYYGEIFDMSYKVGTDDDKWLMFQYHYTETDDVTDEVIYDKTEIYTFDKETATYLVTPVSESAKAGTKGEAYKNEQGVYAFENLMPGMTMEGFDVVEAYNVNDEELGFKLSGNKTLKGKILVNEMYGDYMFESDDPLLTSPIRMHIDTYDYDIDRPTMAYFDQSFVDRLTEEQRQYLSEHGSAEVSVEITSFSMGIKIGTEDGENIEINDMRWSKQNNADDTVTAFQNESFTTSEQGTVTLDYNTVSAVVIPMQESINSDMLNKVEVSFEGQYINDLKFTVIGKILEVKVNNIYMLGDVGEWEYLGDIENAIVTVKANLMSDMSNVVVHYKVDMGNGVLKDFEFTLDGMRDPSAYNIYVY
jgi:hypothetical protein